jgi:hypothetical protein
MLSKRAEFLVRHNGTTKWDGEVLFSQALLFSSRKSPMLLKKSKDKNAGLLPLRDFFINIYPFRDASLLPDTLRAKFVLLELPSMDFNRPSMDEGHCPLLERDIWGDNSRWSYCSWNLYPRSIPQCTARGGRESHDKDRATLQLQIATTSLAAKQAFNSKHLELCAQATGDAGTIATTRDKSKLRLAEDDFWRLYWGPLGIVEESEVERAMVAFGECLNDREGKNDLHFRFACNGAPLTKFALDLAQACRSEVSKDFQLDLPSVPPRPPPNNKTGASRNRY